MPIGARGAPLQNNLRKGPAPPKLQSHRTTWEGDSPQFVGSPQPKGDSCRVVDLAKYMMAHAE